MRRATAPTAAFRAALLLALLVGPGVAGCSSQQPQATTETTPAASPSESGPGPADAYCEAVDDFIAANRAAVKDPLEADPKALQRQYEDLKQQAEALPGQLIDDPDAIPKVQACTQRLQQFNAAQ